MNKFNYLLVGAVTPFLLLAGCGPSIEDARRHAEDQEPSEPALVVNEQHDDHHNDNIDAHDNTDVELDHSETAADIAQDSHVHDTADMSIESQQKVKGEVLSPASTSSLLQEGSQEADLSNAKLLAKIELLQERLQKADVLKSDLSSELSKIDRLLSENESEINQLHNALNSLEQSVDQLNLDVDEVNELTDGLVTEQAAIDHHESKAVVSEQPEAHSQQPADEATSSHTATH